MKIHAAVRIKASDISDCAFLNNILGYKKENLITPKQKVADGSYLLNKGTQYNVLSDLLKRHKDSLKDTYEKGDYVCKVLEVEGRKITVKTDRYSSKAPILELE